MKNQRKIITYIEEKQPARPRKKDLQDHRRGENKTQAKVKNPEKKSLKTLLVNDRGGKKNPSREGVAYKNRPKKKKKFWHHK